MDILESSVGRPVECVAFRGCQGAMRSNSQSIETIRNADKREMQRAIQVVAHPLTLRMEAPMSRIQEHKSVSFDITIFYIFS